MSTTKEEQTVGCLTSIWDCCLEAEKEIENKIISLEREVENVIVPQPQNTTGKREKRSSLLMAVEPHVIRGALSPEHFVNDSSKDLNSVESENIIKNSQQNEDLIVGYQITLASSKKVWVIIGLKRFRLCSTEYLLRNKTGEDKWCKLKRGNSSGKTFTLKRKVAKL